MTPTQRAAMQAALEALVIAEAGLADIGDADREPGDDLAWCEQRASEALDAPRKAIEQLRAALAELEVEQEPVAITTKTQIEEMQHGYSRAIVGRDPKFWLVKRDDDVPLYTAPPRRELVELTEQEIWDAVKHGAVGGIGMPSKAVVVARAIEAGLKEKNQ